MALSEFFQVSSGPIDMGANEDAKLHTLYTAPAGYKVEVIHAYVSAEADVAPADDNYNILYLLGQSKTTASGVIATIANGPLASGYTFGTTPTELTYGGTQGLYATASKVVGGSTATSLHWVLAKTGNGQALTGLTLQAILKHVPATT